MDTRRRGFFFMTDGPLSGWMRTLINYVRSGEADLTNRQMALLMMIYLTPGPHTVRGIAAALGVSKPVVTRALNTLGSLGYLRRERDQDDRRNIFVVRTKDGTQFLENFKRYLRASDSPAARPAIGGAGRTNREPAFADR
jgi:DNA-binding MarR family transcriptional regulator